MLCECGLYGAKESQKSMFAVAARVTTFYDGVHSKMWNSPSLTELIYGRWDLLHQLLNLSAHFINNLFCGRNFFFRQKISPALLKK